MQLLLKRSVCLVVGVAAIGSLAALTACSGGSAAPTSAATSTTPPPKTAAGQRGAFFGRGGTSGTIAKMDAGVITLTTADGQVTVNTTADTRVEKAVPAALGDLKVGQFLTVTGTAGTDGSIAASSVTVTTQQPAFRNGTDSRTGFPGGTPPFTRPAGTPPFTRSGGPPGEGAFGGGGTFGTIASISGSMLTLTGLQGQSTIMLIVPGTVIEELTAASLGDLSVGQAVTVSGRPNDQGSIDALSITIGR